MPYQLVETTSFLRGMNTYSDQPAVNKAWGQLQAQLRKDPFRAQTRKLEATRVDLYRSKVDDGRRVVWALHEQSVVLLLIGEHDDVYARARRIGNIDHATRAVTYAEDEVRRVRHDVDTPGLLTFLTDRELMMLGVPADQIGLARAVEHISELDVLLDVCGDDAVVALTLVLEGASFEEVRDAAHTQTYDSTEGVQDLVAQAVEDVATTIGNSFEEQVTRVEAGTRDRFNELEQRFESLAEALQRTADEKQEADKRNRALAERLNELEAARSEESSGREAAERAAADARRAVAAAEMRVATAEAASHREAGTTLDATAAVRAARVGEATIDAAGPVPAKKAPVKKAPAKKAPAKKAPAKKSAPPQVDESIQELLAGLRNIGTSNPAMTSRLAPSGDQSIGSHWTGRATGRTYSLLLKADVVDRDRNRYLSQDLGVEPARGVGTRLLRGRPEGGRITVNTDGHVITRRTPGGPLVYVGRVTADEWFPGHVTYRPQASSMPAFGGPPPAVRPPVVPSGRTANGTVPAILSKLWGFRLAGGAPARFRQAGWSFVGFIQVPCPQCRTALAELRKPMTGGNKRKRYWALVCTNCEDVRTPDQIDAEDWQHRRVRYGMG